MTEGRNGGSSSPKVCFARDERRSYKRSSKFRRSLQWLSWCIRAASSRYLTIRLPTHVLYFVLLSFHPSDEERIEQSRRHQLSNGCHVIFCLARATRPPAASGVSRFATTESRLQQTPVFVRNNWRILAHIDEARRHGSNALLFISFGPLRGDLQAKQSAALSPSNIEMKNPIFLQ
jgi:hypothetical protein